MTVVSLLAARRGLAKVTEALGVRSAIGTAIGAVFAAAKVPPPGLRHGLRPTPSPADELPVAIVVLLGADADAVAATVADLADIVAGAVPGAPAVRPLLLLDHPHFGPVRQAGLPFDHVLPEEEWLRRGTPGTWADHLHWRVQLLRRQYATSTVLVLPPEGSSGMAHEDFLAGLRPPVLSPAAQRRRRAVAWLERRLDAPSAS